MTLRLLLILNAILALVFGVGFLVIPTTLLPLYDIPAEPGTLYIARLLGGAMLGYGALSWYLRDATGPAMRAVAMGYLVGFAASAAGGLVGQLAGQANSLGWITVLIDTLFALGYGYLAFIKPVGR